jgi:hypothetical protein
MWSSRSIQHPQEEATLDAGQNWSFALVANKRQISVLRSLEYLAGVVLRSRRAYLDVMRSTKTGNGWILKIINEVLKQNK